MKKLLVIVCFLLSVVSCKNTVDYVETKDKPYPKLMVVHDAVTGDEINKVELVNYTFHPLQIKSGESQTFSLSNGMLGGYENIYICVTLNQRVYAIRKNFENGKTTVVRLYGKAGVNLTIE